MSDDSFALDSIADNTILLRKELNEANRLKRLELKLLYNIPDFDLEDWGLTDQVE